MILERFKVPAKDQVFVSEAALRKTVTQIFEKLGLTPDDAAEGADVLTMTDLRGVETHGVSNMLRAYVRDYKAGKLDPKPGWRIVRQTPGTAVIDAERRLGIIVGPKAMRLAVEKARTVGVGAVTVYNSGHFGAIGHYAMQAALQGMVGVCFTGAGLSVVPTFASKPMLGTNPIAIAAPARSPRCWPPAAARRITSPRTASRPSPTSRSSRTRWTRCSRRSGPRSRRRARSGSSIRACRRPRRPSIAGPTGSRCTKR